LEIVRSRMDEGYDAYYGRETRRRREVDVEAPPKRSRAPLIIAIVAIVLVVCICVICAASLIGAELYAGSILTATASAPTPTPPATDTPVPTNTPLPTPTATITPTPDALGYLNPDEKKYYQTFQTQSQRWTEGRQKFDALMADPKPSDGTWKSEIIGELTAWKDLANQARGLQNVGRFQPAQDRYLEAVEKYDLAASLAIEGINNQDVVAFDQSKQELGTGDRLMNEAKGLFDSLKNP